MTIRDFAGTYFHAMLPDVVIHTASEWVNVKVTFGSQLIYDEHLLSVGETVTVFDMPQMVEPWIRSSLAGILSVMATADDGSETASASCRVIYGNVDMDATAQEFVTKRFLTLLGGEKRTAVGRLEYLHYIGSETGSVECWYSDGTKETKATTTVGGNGNYTTIDVSPDRFSKDGAELVKYVVSVGSRKQEYVMDLMEPDCAPILIFTNSFGCQELIYCVGKHEVKPEYTRSMTIIGAKKRNYSIVEQRKFEADTGVLTVGEMNWVDELFRSMEIYVVNFVNGNPRIGREVLMLDSKSEFSNEENSLNRATFSYTYAQRCHNIIDTQRAGRIFDNTFDNTFD